MSSTLGAEAASTQKALYYVEPKVFLALIRLNSTLKKPVIFALTLIFRWLNVNA
jgi:hypothetical protein